MTDQTNEAALSPSGPDRSLKGTAMTMIAEENRRRQDKTERLKALRLAQDAAEPPADVPAKRTKAKAAPSPASKTKPKTKRAAREAIDPSQPHSG